MTVPAELIDALKAAGHVLALTGSGASAESGVPTFREARSGLWENFDPHELATPEAFLRDPETVWGWYRWRRELVAGVEPNPGHYALVSLAGLVPRLTLVTQNVDGLHQRAGSEEVIEYHGNLFDDRCFSGCSASLAKRSAGPMPRCGTCGGHMRPGVVWFGEPIPQQAMAAADAAARECDVFLSIGTSALVWPAAGLAEIAAGNGATVVEINLDPTPLSGRSHFPIRGKSGEILPELVDCLTV
jgi:NAD-dependent deacetylase